MGTCYSLKAHGADPYTVCPSEMPQAEPTAIDSPSSSSTDQALHKPYGGRYGLMRNSNEQTGKDSERGALTTLSENAPRMASTTTAKPKSRFGFKAPAPVRKPDPNSNLMTTSTDSVGSAASSHSGSGSKTEGLDSKGSKRPKSQAFEAEGADKWLMIDDSRSNSRASSLKSRKSSKERQAAAAAAAAEDATNGNTETSSGSHTINGKSQNGDRSSVGATSRGSAGGSRLQTKLKGPFTRFSGSKTNGSSNNKWVKATAATDQTDAAGDSKHESSAKKAEHSVKKEQLSGKKMDHTPKKDHNGKKAEQKTGQRAVTFLRNIGKAKTPSKSSQPKDKSTPVGAKSKTVGAACRRDQAKQTVGDEDLRPVSETTALLVKAPIAVIDSVETTSIGSVNSDDLMLDFDINLEGYEDDPHGKSMRSLEKFGRNRSRTKSQDSVDGVHRASGGAVSKAIEPPTTAVTVAKYERKPMHGRGRYASESSGVPRRHNSGGSQKMAAYRRGQNEAPLQELATLIHDNPGVRRRPPKLSKLNRPASFPCQTRKDSGGAAVAPCASPEGEEAPQLPAPNVRALKPPRQTPSIGDDELISLDGFTYRHMIQDMTNLKTMLLKLRRVIQEDEFGSWKNGLRLSGSQPNSPMREDLTLLSFLEEGQESPGSDKLVQENFELKQQLQLLQRRLEEQEMTVKLLQQQMTKYEYGDDQGAAGCSVSTSMLTVSTQTDKQLQQQQQQPPPSLPAPRSCTSALAKAPRNSSVLPRYRTELSSDSLQANDMPTKKASIPLTSGGAGNGCIGIASALGADEVFERAENGAYGPASESEGSSGHHSPLFITEDDAPTSAAGLNGTFTMNEEGDGDSTAALKFPSNETVTTDTSGYVSDVTSLAEASQVETSAAPPKPPPGGSTAITKPKNVSSALKKPKHIAKAAPKSGIPNSRSNPTSIAKPAGAASKQSKLQSPLPRGGQSGVGRGRGSRLPAPGASKKLARSTPQLHSYVEQQTASG